jgi:hypothetical protein
MFFVENVAILICDIKFNCHVKFAHPVELKMAAKMWQKWRQKCGKNVAIFTD